MPTASREWAELLWSCFAQHNLTYKRGRKVSNFHRGASSIGPWSGSYSELNCRVASPANCGSVAHNGRSYRTRFQSNQATAPETCRGESQSQLCINGLLQPWQSAGGFQHESCTNLPNTSWCDAIPNLGPISQGNGCTMKIERCDNNSGLLGIRKLTPSGQNGDGARQSCSTALQHCAIRCGKYRILFSGIFDGIYEN